MQFGVSKVESSYHLLNFNVASQYPSVRLQHGKIQLGNSRIAEEVDVDDTVIRRGDLPKGGI